MPKPSSRLLYLLFENYSANASHELLVRTPSENIVYSQTNEASTANGIATMLSPRRTSPQTIFLQNSTVDPGSPSIFLLARSASSPISQLPQLSSGFLVVLTAGAIALLAILAIVLYCCTRCRKRNKLRNEKQNRCSGSGSPSELERGRVMGPPLEAWRRSVEAAHGSDSLSALEFSPPSPNWRPKLPSIAYLSSNPRSNGSSNGMSSGHGQILDAEAIMKEREPGRRKVYGGGGWANIPVSTVISSISPGNQVTNPPYHPENAHSAQPSLNGSLRVGIGMPTAPPLPSQAPRSYKPPSYHRRSRIVPRHTDKNSSQGSYTMSDPRSQPGSEHNFAFESHVPITPVPRIEVHLAQDNFAADKHAKRRSRKIGRIQRSRSRSTGSKSDGLRRNSSTASQCSRPVSGLGITTINLGTGCSTSDTGRNGTDLRNLVPTPASPTSPSDEDVRLAYRSSPASVDPESVRTSSRVEAASVRRKSTSKDKRISSIDPMSVVKSRTNTYLKAEKRSSQSVSCSPSLKRPDFSKRQGLGVGMVDQHVKAELHDMRSLGSESFDNLIAYLDESFDHEGDDLHHTETRTRTSNSGNQRESEARNGLERKRISTTTTPPKTMRMTREETAHVEKESYDAWVGTLNATPSELRLAHLDADSSASKTGRMSLRASRRGRNTGESAQNNVRKGTKAHGRGKSVSRVPLVVRDMNADSGTTYRKNQSEVDTDVLRKEPKSEVSIHVRALRARSASLKVKGKDKNEYLEGHGFAGETVSGSKVHSGEALVSSSVAAHVRPIMDRRQRLMSEKESILFSTKSQEPLAGLPSFSVPSSATQLYATYPTSEDSSRAFLSESTSKDSGYSDLDRIRERERVVAARQVSLRSRASAVLETSSSKTVCASASASDSKAISSAAYIARCAPTPHFKSAAVMSFLAPSPSSASRHRLPLPELSRSRSRLSCDSIGSSDSACSAASAWGRRSEWGRESLTPRFDHLRTVLEGRSEVSPPPPVPVLQKRRSRVGLR